MIVVILSWWIVALSVQKRETRKYAGVGAISIVVTILEIIDSFAKISEQTQWVIRVIIMLFAVLQGLYCLYVLKPEDENV